MHGALYLTFFKIHFIFVILGFYFQYSLDLLLVSLHNKMSDINELFTIGKQYTSISELRKDIQDYNEKFFTNLVINSNNLKAVLIECKHRRDRKTELCGTRPKQHYKIQP